MATAKVRAALQVSADWAAIEGSAASVAGMTWQNLGPDPVLISFNATAPIATTAFHRLNESEAFYDKSGSAKVWAKSLGIAGATVCGTAD